MSSLNPEVQQALDFADQLSDRLMASLDEIRSYTAERLSADQEIAVKVDMNGQLVDLWLKPGVLDRKSAAAIAKEISQLTVAAGEDAAIEVERLYSQSAEFVGDEQTPGAGEAR